MATSIVTFGGAVKPGAPGLWDHNIVTPNTGAVMQGIGLGSAAVDGTPLPGAEYIGGGGATLNFDTDGNVATP